MSSSTTNYLICLTISLTPALALLPWAALKALDEFCAWAEEAALAFIVLALFEER